MEIFIIQTFLDNINQRPLHVDMDAVRAAYHLYGYEPQTQQVSDFMHVSIIIVWEHDLLGNTSYCIMKA